MFKVSLPSTHSNISNFCIHFQASPSASDSLTHIYLCIFSVRVCVCACARIQSVSFSVSVYMYKIQSNPTQDYIFPFCICSHGKEISSLESYLFSAFILSC